MELFPLWSVSSIARSRIINRMNPAEVIELAIRCKPFRDFLSSYKLPAVDLEWNCSKQQTLLLKFPSLENSVQFDVQQDRKENPIETDIEALKNVARQHKGFVIGDCKNVEKSVEALEEVIKLIAKIAHVKNYKLVYLHNPAVNILSSCIFRLTNTFSQLTLDNLNDADRMKLTEQQIRHFLEDVRCDGLSLSCDLEGGPRILENIKFNQKYLSLGDCDWLHPRELLNGIRNNLELQSFGASFTQPYGLEEFMKFVSGWQRGEILQDIYNFALSSGIEWPATQGLKVQEDFTVTIVPASGETFREFKGKIKRLTDGKVGWLYVCSNIRFSNKPYGSLSFLSH